MQYRLAKIKPFIIVLSRQCSLIACTKHNFAVSIKVLVKHFNRRWQVRQIRSCLEIISSLLNANFLNDKQFKYIIKFFIGIFNEKVWMEGGKKTPFSTLNETGRFKPLEKNIFEVHENICNLVNHESASTDDFVRLKVFKRALNLTSQHVPFNHRL